MIYLKVVYYIMPICDGSKQNVMRIQCVLHHVSFSETSYEKRIMVS